MRTNDWIGLLLIIGCVGFSGLVWAGGSAGAIDTNRRMQIQSPDQKVQIEFGLRDGLPAYQVEYRDKLIVVPSALRLELAEPFEGGFEIGKTSSFNPNTSWKPVYGERSQIRDNCVATVVELIEKGPLARRMKIEMRVYDEGVAFRYHIPAEQAAKKWTIKQERSEFRFADGSMAYPIYSTEQTFSTTPVSINEMKSGAHTPLTVKLVNGFASVLEANVENYPRMRLGKTKDGALVSQLLGSAEISAPFASPWRAILLGADEGRLIENEHLVLNLNPPCAIEDTRWVVAGKTISDHGNVGLNTAELKKVIDFASASGFKYLQLDWGWYGTEWAWTDTERATFRKTVPSMAAETDWVVNTYADPYKVAKGPVPYRPDWKNVTRVDLDMPELIRYAKEHGMGVCLYVECNMMLRAHDMDKLFATYESWGVAGLKPGFVRYGSQENTAWIRQLVETAAKHKLILCIHDAHVPDGMERTWPNLMISEGGGGQEGNHPAEHDVMLPFTRCLAGAFDYTPNLYTKGKSHAHMLAFYVVYYGPASTLRGGYKAWEVAKGPDKGGAEREFLGRVPASWDETRVLDAEIGRRIVVARRSGEAWFVGGMTGETAETVELPLDFLAAGKSYNARIFADDPSARSGDWCPAKLETRMVTAEDKLKVSMEKAGGFVAIFESR